MVRHGGALAGPHGRHPCHRAKQEISRCGEAAQQLVDKQLDLVELDELDLGGAECVANSRSNPITHITVHYFIILTVKSLYQ